ncbi:DUF222 domain-containing protein [Nocardioides sp.]|uniref:HNH endonuclease signature motif containing protein n=1 Tax=Nocardioides sp. TaxID=35761 RepID=UPI003784FA23
MSRELAITTAVEGVGAAVAALVGVDWDEVPAGELPGVMVELERVRARLDAARLEVADRLETSGATVGLGWASTKDFLTTVSGGRKGAGGGLLRVAAALRDLPDVRDGLADGWLSEPKARVIARRVGQLPRVEAVRAAAARVLLDKARDLDATDLDRAWPDVIAEIDPDGRLLGRELDLPRAERAAHHARFLGFSPDELGGVRISGYADAESVEEVKAALLPLAVPVPTDPGACGGIAPDLPAGRRGTTCPDPGCTHDGRDPREPGARLWDALVETCRRLQGADLVPTTHGVRPRLTVTIALDDLRGRLHATGRLPGDQSLSAAAVRRLACDADLIPLVLGTHSQVLDVGRTRRLVTTAIWLALIARDRHCTFPGCHCLPSACDAHHVIHWADGGPTSLDNLALLCRHHHTVAHQTAWTLTIDPVTRRPAWHPPPRTGDGRITWHLTPPYRAA